MTETNAIYGTITDIQRFSLHDGPGIRTTVFLKGCNMQCGWCHNPETIHPHPEIQVFPQRCIGCRACVAACPHGIPEDWRSVCDACGACAAACYAEARVLAGKRVSVDEVMRELLADQAFYQQSGGGVTLSGGEPFVQATFTQALLTRAKAEGIHTAIETNLNWPWAHIAPALPFLDLLLLDIKVMDESLHRAWTGVDNRLILANLLRLAAAGLPFIVRTPVVPGVNDSVEEITRIAGFLAPLPGLRYYELLHYHPLGVGKYASLDRPYPATAIPMPEHAIMEGLATAARAYGIDVRIG
ncbi:MAG: glycyl-radical enzyme activating protein [bacterium]